MLRICTGTATKSVSWVDAENAPHKQRIAAGIWKESLLWPFCVHICFQEDRDYIFICEVNFHIKDKNIDVVKRLKYNCS